MKRMSTSLLTQIKYNQNNPIKLREIIEGTKFETSPAAQAGIDFEQDVAILNGTCKDKKEVKKDDWYSNKEKIAAIVKNMQWQVPIEKIIRVDGEDYRIKGFLDFYDDGETIIDVKTTAKYIPNEMKFLMSTQHLFYFECKPKANKFRYLINSWDNSSNIYEEKYGKKENNRERIEFNIITCRNILLKNGLDYPELINK